MGTITFGRILVPKIGTSTMTEYVELDVLITWINLLEMVDITVNLIAREEFSLIIIIELVKTHVNSPMYKEINQWMITYQHITGLSVTGLAHHQVIDILCGIIPAMVVVMLLSKNLLQALNSSVLTNVLKMRLFTLTELVWTIVLFLRSTEINGPEISAIILVNTAGICTGTVRVFPHVLILYHTHLEMDNSTAIIQVPHQCSCTITKQVS
jgi:hypothetical protein